MNLLESYRTHLRARRKARLQRQVLELSDRLNRLSPDYDAKRIRETMTELVASRQQLETIRQEEATHVQP